jgi:two-component system aerobic respiration control sensor histidine kinase ArcB
MKMNPPHSSLTNPSTIKAQHSMSQEEENKRLNFLLKKTREQLNKAHAELTIANDRAETAETYLNNLVKSTSDHFYWIDKDGVVLGCNEQQAKSFGLTSQEDLIGKNIYEFLYQLKWENPLVEALRSTNVQVMQTGIPAVKEETAFFQGQEHVFLSHKNPLFDREGNIIGVFGHSIDITAHKEAEEMLLEAKRQAETERIEYEFKKRGIHYESFQDELTALKQRLETNEVYLNNFIKHAPGYFYWVDKKGKLLGCNQAQAEIFGFKSADEFSGKNIYEMLYDLNWDSKNVEALRINNLSVMNNGQLQITEEKGIFDGVERTFLSHKCPMRNKDNDIIGIIGFSVEITERKKAEMAAWEAKEQAEKANKVKTEFLENMRHDLRTPFSGIVGLAQSLEMQETDPDKKDSLGWVVKSSTQILDVLNDILAGANTGVRKDPKDYDVFSLKEMVSNLTDLLAAEIRWKKLDFEVQLDEKIPPMLAGDKLRLQRILLNLLTNAIKFTEKGSVHLNMSTQDNQSEKLNLVIVVKDTGIGIPANKLNTIFQKFVKLKPSFLSNTYVGVGVGLTIVQNLVQELSGTIKVESKEGEGTTFTCTIPFDIPV